ncbi:MAG TPA: glycosyltransferase family 4 protein [Planctomycetota bacterium]|nr:glycosyltransferase family 4 protein [Planctomycetota bacterium]
MATRSHRPTRTKIIKMPFDDAPGTRPLKVLALSAAGEIGGAERSLLEVVHALPPERIEVHACVPPDSPLSRNFQALNIAVHPVAMRRFQRTKHPFLLAGQVRALHKSACEIGAICKELGIDLVHANTNAAELIAWEVTRTSKVRHVWHCRDSTPMHGFGRILGNSASAVVAISAFVESQLKREGIRESKIHRIVNGIDLKRFAPAMKAALRSQVRANLGIEATRPVLLSVGAYVPWKKHELFLDVLSILRLRMPNVIGLLAGSDNFGQNAVYENSLKQKAHLLGLSQNNLRLLHQRDDIPQLMAASDIFVSCSENEPFGRVLVEAGAAALPVVATASGAKPEIVEDQVSGILTPQSDAAAMAAACSGLLEDDALRERMGQSALHRAQDLFDVRRAAGELADLFEKTAALKGTRSVGKKE